MNEKLDSKIWQQLPNELIEKILLANYNWNILLINKYLAKKFNKKFRNTDYIPELELYLKIINNIYNKFGFLIKQYIYKIFNFNIMICFIILNVSNGPQIFILKWILFFKSEMKIYNIIKILQFNYDIAYLGDDFTLTKKNSKFLLQQKINNMININININNILFILILIFIMTIIILIYIFRHR